MTIKDFCDKHKACKAGYARARHFKNMDDFFANSTDHDDVIWACTRVMTKKEKVKFGCWCVRQIWDLLVDKRSRNAVIVGEKYAQGFVSDGELEDATYAAAVACADAADDCAAAQASAYACADAADADADNAAVCAAYDEAVAAVAAAHAAHEAAFAAAQASAYACADAADACAAAHADADAAKKKQVEYLKNNFVFNWEG